MIDDGRRRCSWADRPADLRAYHDEEWGWPVADGRRLFEKLSLEVFQAGLSWLTILRKREAFRTAFAGFVPRTVAGFDDADRRRLLADAGIVRNRRKIDAVVENARIVARLGTDRFGALVWSVEGEPDPPAALHAALRRLGFRFVGPTICASLLQSVGVVDGHEPYCWLVPRLGAARAAFRRPALRPARSWEADP